jgi:hypothetical protein
MTVRSMAPRVGLAAAAAAVVVSLSAPGAGATVAPAAPAAPSTSSANAVELVTPPVWLTDVRNPLDPGETQTIVVDVPTAGTYYASYLVSSPKTASLIRTVVDGTQLPDAAGPAAPGQFGVIVTTESFDLTAGKHTFDLTGVKIPTGGSASGTLFESMTKAP